MYQVWGEKMAKAIVDGMEKERVVGNLELGQVSENNIGILKPEVEVIVDEKESVPKNALGYSNMPVEQKPTESIETQDSGPEELIFDDVLSCGK